MAKVMVFGNLPLTVGGKQSSGASAVMWRLCETINEMQSGFKVEFVATDIFYKQKMIANTLVFGWNFSVVVKQVFNKIFSSVSYLKSAVKVSRRYKLSFVSVYIKLVWFDAIVRKNLKAIYHIHGSDYFVILKEIFSKYAIPNSNVVYTVHAIAGNDKNIPGFELERMKEAELSVYKPYAITFVSNQLRVEWESNYSHTNNVVISNAVDDVYLNFKNANLVVKRDYSKKIKIITTVGSISDRKGQRRILEAISTSSNKENIIYKCVGDGEPRTINQLTQFAKANGINLEYCGVLKPQQVIEVLLSSHYMMLPSSSEGFGLVYLESLCTGTPVILPEQLPITKEINLSSNNSILLKDFSTVAIKNVLDNIHTFDFDSVEVANSISVASWNQVANEYINIYKAMYEAYR